MPRKTSYEILHEVICNQAYASLSMKKMNHLKQNDMALVSTLVYGVLRNWDLLKLQWSGYVTKKCSRKTEILLNMAVYQIHFLDRIPEYAILKETVDLASKHEKGFVNAVLRKCIQMPLIKSDDPDIVKRTSINCSVPQWILNLWNKQYGEEIMVKIAESTLRSGSTTGRINPVKCTAEELVKDANVRMIDDFAFEYDGNLIQSDWFRSGKVIVQDLSSQKAARMVGVRQHEIVLDCCSAPGGKTTLMAALMNNTGKVIACDLYENRLELVREASVRLGLNNIETQTLDSTMAHEIFEAESFDRMLLDVPCSGLGTLSQKPEIAFTMTPSGLDEISSVQKKILDSCAPLLKPGGTMVYSTCTLNQKENSRQIKSFLHHHPEYELVCEETRFPFEGNWDGFYIAKLSKNNKK